MELAANLHPRKPLRCSWLTTANNPSARLCNLLYASVRFCTLLRPVLYPSPTRSTITYKQPMLLIIPHLFPPCQLIPLNYSHQFARHSPFSCPIPYVFPMFSTKSITLQSKCKFHSSSPRARKRAKAQLPCKSSSTTPPLAHILLPGHTGSTTEPRNSKIGTIHVRTIGSSALYNNSTVILCSNPTLPFPNKRSL